MLKYAAEVTSELTFVYDEETYDELTRIFYWGVGEDIYLNPNKYPNRNTMIEHGYKLAINELIKKREWISIHPLEDYHEDRRIVDWQTELRIKLSNWFFQQDGLEDFSKIAKKHKLLTGYIASALMYEEFFDTEKEMDLSICFDIVYAFQIPLTIKSMEVEIQ